MFLIKIWKLKKDMFFNQILSFLVWTLILRSLSRSNELIKEIRTSERSTVGLNIKHGKDYI